MAAHRCSAFAQKQLEKHGWQAGQGLGRTESGISEAIKVKIKHDTAGVGHDLGEQFTYHWWDHVFNKAANNIVVENDQEGVKLKSKETSHGPISNRKQSKSAGKKPLLYGNFVRSATLTTEGLHQDNQDSSSSEEEESNTEETNIDDRFFKACGGRTAHKGARHGLTLSGKLKRIQEQEDGYPHRHHKKHQAQPTDSPPTRLGEDQIAEDDVDEETPRNAGEGNQERKRWKKDKKRRMKASMDNGRCDNDEITLDITCNENDAENVLPESGKVCKEEQKHKTKKDDRRCDEDDESERLREEKQRKKDKKRKKREELRKSANSCQDDATDLGDNMVSTNDEAAERKRVKKARKELKLKERWDGASNGENLNGFLVEENEEDQDRKKKKKKDKRRKLESVDVCETNEDESSEPLSKSVTKGGKRTNDETFQDIRTGDVELGEKTKKKRKGQLQQGDESHGNKCTDDRKTSKKTKKKKSKH